MALPKRTWVLLAAAVLAAPATLGAAYLWTSQAECDAGLGCIPLAMGIAFLAAIGVGIAWGFAVRTHRELWAPALHGLLTLLGMVPMALESAGWIALLGILAAGVVAGVAAAVLALRRAFRRPDQYAFVRVGPTPPDAPRGPPR